MKLSIQTNFSEVIKSLQNHAKATPSVLREAMNRTTDRAKDQVVAEMRRSFDRPVPFTLRSLRVYYANSANLTSTLWFRQRSADKDKLWAGAQIAGGAREPKPFERRLQNAGILPKGWMAVPSVALKLDAFGNMSQGEISRLLNVLGALKESGYNKANGATVSRLKRGTKRSYGFEYFVNKPGASGPGARLLPGIYKRVATPFGSSLKPVLIFVNSARYRPRLAFKSAVDKSIDRNFRAEFDRAWDNYAKTGSASAGRRG